MIERIVYVSRATPGVDSRSAYDIIRVSHNRNSRHSLTGALIFLDGFFMQVLEGDRYLVEERMAVIAADTRHTAFDVRLKQAGSSRLFDGEWMALRQSSDISEVTLQAFSYAPGYPAELFDGERLIEFALACCKDYSKRL